MATTSVPGQSVDGTFGPTSSTRPKLSWPVTRKSSPGGAAPYSAALISLSVPSTPTRSTRTFTPRPSGMSPTLGSGLSRDVADGRLRDLPEMHRIRHSWMNGDGFHAPIVSYHGRSLQRHPDRFS